MEYAPSSNNYIPGELGTQSVSLIDWIRSLSLSAWLLIFIVLAFLGFNIFVLIGQGAEDIGSWTTKVIDKIKETGKFMNTIKNTIFVSATGTKGIINSTAEASDEILEKVQDKTNVGLVPQESEKTSLPQTSITSSSPSLDISQANTLNKAINTSSVQQANASNMNYQADDTLTSIQSGGSKAGWCFIGEDRGFRSCAYVNAGDECMSGDIFPSNEICVNPNLRS